MFHQVATRGLCAIAQAESLRYKLIGGLAVRRACYGVLRFIMESGAKVKWTRSPTKVSTEVRVSLIFGYRCIVVVRYHDFVFPHLAFLDLEHL